MSPRELINFNLFSISKQRFQNWFSRKIYLSFHTIILYKSINISKHRIANTGVYSYNIHITNNFTKFRKTVNFFALFVLALVWDEIKANLGQDRNIQNTKLHIFGLWWVPFYRQSLSRYHKPWKGLALIFPRWSKVFLRGIQNGNQKYRKSSFPIGPEITSSREILPEFLGWSGISVGYTSLDQISVY